MEITTAIKNFEAGSATLTNFMADLQNGEGLAGRDEKMASDLAGIAYHLSTTRSLNTRGLMGILWQHTNSPPPRTGQPVADHT